jgi:hypothetical protein
LVSIPPNIVLNSRLKEEKRELWEIRKAIWNDILLLEFYFSLEIKKHKSPIKMSKRKGLRGWQSGSSARVPD